MEPAHAYGLRDRLAPAAALVAMAIATVVWSRTLLRSERELATLATGSLPYVVAAVSFVIAARWLFAARRGVLAAVSFVELSLTACIACVCIATLLLPRSPFWTYALLPYLILGVSFALARRFVDGPLVRWALAITGVLVAVSVLVDALGVAGVSPLRRPGGLLGNRNFAGEYLALALPAVLVVFTRSRRWLVVLVGFGAAIALTRCRTAWIAGSFATVALVMLSPSAARARRALGAAALVVGIVVAMAVPTRLAWREASPFAATLARAVDLGSGSGQLRLRQYKATLHVLDARGAWWTGVGAGGWQAAIRAQDRALGRNRVPHSDYLRVLSDGGAPALGALCIMLLAAAIAAWRARKQHVDLCVFIGVLALVALADAPLFRPEVIVVTGAVLATLTKQRAMARTRSCGLEPAAREPQ